MRVGSRPRRGSGHLRCGKAREQHTALHRPQPGLLAALRSGLASSDVVALDRLPMGRLLLLLAMRPNVGVQPQALMRRQDHLNGGSAGAMRRRMVKLRLERAVLASILRRGRRNMAVGRMAVRHIVRGHPHR